MTPQEMQADADAFSKQYDAEQAAKAQQEAAAKNPQPPDMLQTFAPPTTKVTPSMLDSVVSQAEQWGTAAKRVGQDVASGALTGAVNIADAAGSALTTSGREMAAAEDPDHAEDARAGAFPTSPIWDHAKASILDLRDAIQVTDPNMVDSLTQGVAQLAVPFAGYSRALAGLHGVANMAAAGAATDLTALAPHDMRMADVLAMARHTEGKLGEVLRTLAPDGSALNGYITYLTDRGNESEAEGRFKNMLDGFGVNMIATPMLHAVGTVLKQGQAGIRYALDNGVRNTVSDLFAGGPVSGSPAAQAGKIVFHGTAADFDHFDSSKIGSGEGGQAYGHGLYFAESPDTARTYSERLGQQYAHPDVIAAQKDVARYGSKRDAVVALNKRADSTDNLAERMFLQRKVQLIKGGAADRASGNLMHVEIPDEHLNNMLDHDAPLDKQPQVVQDALARGDLPRPTPMKLPDGELPVRGGDLYKALSRQLASPSKAGDIAASERLAELGVPGIRYLDAGSRGAGGGTHNLVLFDPKAAKIVKKE